ncbi:MAG: hypothetical protein PF693_07965, partial [Spirochaetia bacterium]|nr:hypothetical protein [Spirochaetia bacterium]
MRLGKYLLLITIIMLFPFSLFAGGQKDLAEKPEGMGVLIIGNEGKFVPNIRWTYKLTYYNNTNNQDYTFEIPSLKDSIGFNYLPSGSYTIKKII